MLHKSHYTIIEMCENANSNSFNPFTCFFILNIMYSVDFVNGITCPLNTYLTILCHPNDHLFYLNMKALNN